MTTICHSSTVQVFTRANTIKQEHPQVDVGVTDGKHCVCAPPELRSLNVYQRSLVRISNNSGWLSSSIIRDRAQSILFVHFHLELVYLVTALVPSDTACLASSPGRSRRTPV